MEKWRAGGRAVGREGGREGGRREGARSNPETQGRVLSGVSRMVRVGGIYIYKIMEYDFFGYLYI